MLSHRSQAALQTGGRRLGVVLWLMVGAVLGGVHLGAADGAPTPAGRQITSVHEFWQLTGDAKQQLQPVKLEFVVCYYDPDWNLLWAEGDDGISYIECGNQRLPIHEGQRIVVEGLMAPAAGLNLKQAQVKVTADNVPLEAVPWKVEEQAGESGSLPTRFVSIDGFVNRETEVDPNHLLLDLTAGKWAVQARVLMGREDAEPQCESAFVRLRGVLVPNLTPGGQLSALALWVARPKDVKIMGWLSSDPRFNEASVPIETLPKISGDRLVRVVGRVWNQEPGHSLTIRDATGQVVILTGQSQPMPKGRLVEAVGFPGTRENEWVLREGLYRLLINAPPGETVPRAAPLTLRLADQILELGNDHAGQAYPVRLFGVVTWSNPAVRFFYVNDASGGIRVVLGKGEGAVPGEGTTVEVEGVSAPGNFAPEVRASRVTVAGSLSMPEAQDVTLEQALTGVNEGQWVELQGYLREAQPDGPWTLLRLTTSAGEFTACVPKSDHLATLVGSVVRLQGVCNAIANKERELVGIRLWVPSDTPDYVQVEQAAPADPFAVAERTVASLRQFSTLQAFNRRVRVSGTVLLQMVGRYLYLQDATGCIQVLSRNTTLLRPGDRIDAVGFPGREGSQLVLREAVYRRTATGREPAPMEVHDPEAVQVDLDGHLVRIAGTLLDTTRGEQTARLMVQAQGMVFEAVLNQDQGGPTAGRWVPGSRVAVTGVYQVQFDEYRHARAYQLQLRSPADVQVLSLPSWWTARRALIATGVFALCSVLGAGWVVTLRRRVRRQTDQIRKQLAKEARMEAELQRSAKLESLGILAGGIAHDFNNLLTVIMGNLTLAKLDAEGQNAVTAWLREAEQGVMRARDLTLQLLTFAKGGDPIRKAVALPEVIRETAEFALHGSKVRCDCHFGTDLWPAHVDKGQIGQVVQNIVINARQAMPGGGVISLHLHNTVVEAGMAPDLEPGRYLKLSIADNAPGIEPDHLSRIFDPYFTTKAGGSGLGLATVYSIIKKHRGRVEVQSTVGRGATFHIWLPAAQRAPSAAPALDGQPATVGVAACC